MPDMRQAHALQISGHTTLGYEQRFLGVCGDPAQKRCNLNQPCSAWFSDRLQQVATRAYVVSAARW